jgi:tetratricopeptide (TPR) repeat protein
VEKIQISKFLIFVWMLFLQAIVYAEEGSDIVQLPLHHFLPSPEINLNPEFIDLSSVNAQLRSDQEFPEISKIFDFVQAGELQKAYVEASRYIELNRTTPFQEWLYFFKADVLFRIQAESDKPQLSVALEDYELASRIYPRSEYLPRALYHMGLIKLSSGLYQEVEQIAERGLADFSTSEFVPRFSVLSGEQAFRSGDFEKALREYSLVIRRYPRNPAAVDSAFRRAFILYKDNRFDEALKTYNDLEKFHSEAFKFLRMADDPSSSSRLLDRIYYGESLFLTKSYKEASNIFQAVGNRFPQHEFTPFVWQRFGDSYAALKQPLAAQVLYQRDYSSNPRAAALARIKWSNLLVATNPVQAQRQSRDLLEEAFNFALEAKDDELAALSLVHLVDFHLRFKNFPRAKAVLEQMREEYPTHLNSKWQEKKYIQVLEAEILDHHRRNDLLAALTVYLVRENELSGQFGNVDVLLKLADAAVDLSLLEKATDILNRVIYVESSELARQQALLKLVGVLIQREDYRRASERLRRFNFAYPTTPYAYLYEKQWADLYRGLDNKERAVEHFERSLKSVENRPDALHEVRMNHIRLGELYQSMALPVKAVQAYQNFINIFADEERFQLSGRAFTDLDKHWIKVSRYRIADLYFETKDYVQALASYKQVMQHVTEEPFRSHAQYRLGESYLALNDRTAALEAFSQIKSEDPNNIWVRAAQSYMQSVQLEVENAIRIFN